MNNQFGMLRAYSIFSKLMSVFTFLFGLVLEGVTIFGWGRLTAFYDVVRAAWKTFADTYNGYNNLSLTSPLIALPTELAPIPIWPLVIVMLLILLFAVTIGLTLWAVGLWIDMRITLAKEERDSRSMLGKAMIMLTHDLSAIAGYFSSLPSPSTKTPK